MGIKRFVNISKFVCCIRLQSVSRVISVNTFQIQMFYNLVHSKHQKIHLSHHLHLLSQYHYFLIIIKHWMRKILQFCNVSTRIINKIAPYTFEDVKHAILKLNFQNLADILRQGYKSTSEDDSLLILALTQGKEDAVIFLVQQFQHLIDFNERNDKGDTPLMLAIFRKLHRAINVLIPKCNLNACDFSKNTSFIIAAANGDIETLILLRKQKTCDTSVRNIDGHSALHRACYFGQIKVVDWLLQNTDLKIGEKDKRGCNSLHLACEGLNINLTRYIMKKVRQSQKLLTVNKMGKMPLGVLREVILQVGSAKLEDFDLRHLERSVGPKSLI